MKVIVNSDQIKIDPRLKIVKAFRIMNKRAGEFKRTMNDVNLPDEARIEAALKFTECVNNLRTLSMQADENGFHLWVNADGKTGHTYEKDYKVTDDATNDYESHLERLRELEQEVLETTLSGARPDPQFN